MSRRNLLLLLMSIILFTSFVFINSVFANSNSNEVNELRYVEVEFSKDMPMDEINLMLTNKLGLTVKEFINVDHVGENTYTGGYLVHPKMNLEEAIKDYKLQYYHALIDGIEVMKERIKYAENDEELKHSIINTIKDLEYRKNNFENGSPIMITKIKVMGNSDQIREFTQKNINIISSIQELELN